MKVFQSFRSLTYRYSYQFAGNRQLLVSQIDRNSLPQIMEILKLVQSNRLSIKDSDTLPQELQSHFTSYQQFSDWQVSIFLVLESQKGIAKQFQTDIVSYVQFLHLYSKFCNRSLPEETFDSLSTVIQGGRHNLFHLTQAFRLSSKQIKLTKIEKKELLNFCIALPAVSNPKGHVTLFHICLKLIALKLTDQSIKLEEATIVIQTLKDIDILTELIKINPQWLKYLVQICMKSIENNDLRNISMLCSVFVNSGDAILFQLCTASTNALQNLEVQKSATNQDIVTILWMLSHINDKNDERFIKALQQLIQQKLQLQIQKSNKVVDQVLSLWSLSKISSENQYLKDLCLVSLTSLFQTLRGVIMNSKSIENLSQFYVAGLRQGLLNEKEAKQIFEKIITYPDFKSKMFGVVLYDTVFQFPQFLATNSTTLNQKLPMFVNNKNIANFYVAMKQQESAQEFLFTKALNILPTIHIDGIILIAEVLRFQNKPDQFIQFHQELLKSFLVQFKDPLQAITRFSGLEQSTAQLFLYIRDELEILEGIEEYRNLPIETLVKCLQFYQTDSKYKINGLGNLLFVCSQLRQSKNSKYSEIISDYFKWMIQFADKFDLLELLQLYRAINELNLNSPEINTTLDDIIIKKLESIDRHSKEESVRQRFLVQFSRQYKPYFQQLTKVYEYVALQ